MYTGEQFPTTRLRRLRSCAWIRDLVAESSLGVQNLVQPLFCGEAQELEKGWKGFAPFYRKCEDVPKFVEETLLPSGVSAVALFPVIKDEQRDAQGSVGLRSDGLIARTIRALKAQCPGITLIADIALDPFTSHGHDGIVTDGQVDNDGTLEVLAEMACLYAEAGVDIVAPSDMMDGRVRVIRKALDKDGFQNVKILSYAAKYNSAFYSTYRAMLRKMPVDGLCKKTYQLDIRNSREAVREALMDVTEGADFLMVKPGLLCLDILSRLKAETAVPLFSYHVTGEYAMLRTASDEGLIDYHQGLWEALSAMRRAGASGIITYGALDAALFMQEASQRL